MSKVKDLTGQKFGRLTVIARGETQGKSTAAYWICQCDCGNKKNIDGRRIRTGATKSCGCLKREVIIRTNTKHGGYKERLYEIWTNMKTRCLNENFPSYIGYGGRGIKICEDWVNSFSAFREWAVGNGYEDNLEIDRSDNNGDYEPYNCKWVTPKMNSNNKRNNHLLTVFGEVKTLMQWSEDERCVIGYSTLRNRINKLGWSNKESITTPCMR